MKLSSPAFEDHGEIPERYTNDGAGISPPLRIEDVPPESSQLTLVVSDPDAPDPEAPKVRFVIWVMYGLPPETEEIPEGCSGDELPPGAGFGRNDWSHAGWSGPRPARGRHRYIFDLYAARDPLPEMSRPTERDLLRALESQEGNLLAHTQLVGLYQARQ